jgi:hypothetical protein
MSSKINHIKRSHRSYAAHRNTAAAFAASRPIPERKEPEYGSGMINPLGLSLVRGLLRKHMRRAAKG